MAAFVLSEVEVLDQDGAARYRDLAAASIEQYGGKYLVRAAEASVAEGREAAGRIVLVEFPSMQRIHEWYGSPEYARALAFRDRALTRRLIFVDGLPACSGGTGSALTPEDTVRGPGNP